jgi:hypothetical protein
MDKNTIVIDGVEYVKKGTESNSIAKSVKGMKYVIVRTYSSGVFAGYLKEKTGQNAILINARRLWYWDGAASLSQLSQEGVSKPENCKFPCEVPEIELDQVIEVLQVTEKAKLSINSVKIWKI